MSSHITTLDTAQQKPIPDQGQPVFPRGDVVASEGPDAQARAESGAPQDYGPNNEQLPEDLQNTLSELVKLVAAESEVARRQEIRRVKQAHYFWRGLHYLWWNERDQNWHLPFEQKLTDQTSIEDLPRYEFVTNIYQAFGQSIVAVLSQTSPRVRFLPKSPSSELDVATAKSATEIVDLVERNNRIGQILAEESFHLWVGGKVGAYVRYVVDGQAFGWHPEQQIEAKQKEVNPARFACPDCAAETPVPNVRRVARPQTQPAPPGNFAGMATISPGMPDAQGSAVPDDLLFCPECGAMISTENWLPPELITVPEVTGTRNVANGQEVVTIVGALELKTPPWAGEQREYPYLQWQMETHLARLRAAYPHAAAKIGSPVVPDASSQYERLARLSQSQGGPFTQGGDINQNLITYQRTWLRPWSFYLLDDLKKREKLLDLFPEGCYVAFAGDAYLESRNESMDDHWRVMHAMPGDGSASGRSALGDSLLSVQERFNTLTNLQMETYDYGVPPTYVDPEAIDVDATQYQSAEPGAIYPARPRPGQPLGASFFVPPPAQVPPDLVQHAQELMGPIAQFLTGAFPSIFGGSLEGQKTASGYAMARDQALGRLGLVWRRIRQFHADMMMLAVDCFRKNRTADVEIPLLGPGMEFDAKWIRLADLKGNILAHPESDEQFPTLWNQKRAVLLQLMGMQEPAIQQTLAVPENLALIKQLVGLTELEIPGEASRTKQIREIAVLLEDAPVEKPGMPGPDGQPGAPQTVPTIVPDAFADNHQVELETSKQWLNSDAGQAAKVNNPDGWANVRAHAMAHEQILQQQQQQAAQAQAQAAAQAQGLKSAAEAQADVQAQVAKSKIEAEAKLREKVVPSEQINFKDLPPEGQNQMAAQAGIELAPAATAQP